MLINTVYLTRQKSYFETEINDSAKLVENSDLLHVVNDASILFTFETSNKNSRLLLIIKFKNLTTGIANK